MLKAFFRLCFIGVAAAICWAFLPSRAAGKSGNAKHATVQKRLDQYGAAAADRLRPHFEKAGLDYPPARGARITLIGLKREKRLELWVSNPGKPDEAEGSAWRKVKSYAILAASGGPGPKLKQGDLQVPEGFYRITFLNPNSRYHLSLRLDYPNAFDRARAKEDGREDLGGDIMIHGRAVSVGCLAMGDPAIEELFTLASMFDAGAIEVILAPADFRVEPDILPVEGLPEWAGGLYKELAARLDSFR